MPERDVARRTADRPDSDVAVGNTLGGQLFKFLIGFIASVCAVFLPALLVYLKYQGDGTLLPPSLQYVIAGFVFAAIVGFVVVLFEWGKRSKPAQVFMTALGIPALVSGALGTVGTADNLKQAVEDRRTFMAEVAQNAGVTISGQPITLSPAPAQPQSRLFDLVPTAWADGLKPIVLAQAAYGVQAAPRQYLVVVLDTPDPKLADARLSEFRKSVPNAAVLHSGGHFYVATSSSPMREQDALTQALRLQKQGIPTSLVPINK